MEIIIAAVVPVLVGLAKIVANKGAEALGENAAKTLWQKALGLLRIEAKADESDPLTELAQSPGGDTARLNLLQERLQTALAQQKAEHLAELATLAAQAQREIPQISQTNVKGDLIKINNYGWGTTIGKQVNNYTNP